MWCFHFKRNILQCLPIRTSRLVVIKYSKLTFSERERYLWFVSIRQTFRVCFLNKSIDGIDYFWHLAYLFQSQHKHRSNNISPVYMASMSSITTFMWNSIVFLQRQRRRFKNSIKRNHRFKQLRWKIAGNLLRK